MTDYTFLPVDIPLALDALDFVKERLENCKIKKEIKEDEIKRIEAVKNRLHITRLKPIVWEHEDFKNSLDVIKSALTVYHRNVAFWVSDRDKFKKIQNDIKKELRKEIYTDRKDDVFNQYYKCLKKEN